MINIYNSKNPDRNKVAEAATQPSKSKINFSKYQDPTNEFTSDELKLSFWYVGNKALLYKIAVISLAVINVGFFIFGAWKWGVYLWQWPQSQKLQQSLSASVDYAGMHTHVAAQPIQIINTQNFFSRPNKFDAVAELVNPNSRFLIKFDYYFLIDGAKTAPQKTFLLPGENRFVAGLGIEGATSGVPTVVLENIRYQRISTHQIPDLASWQSYRLNFQVSNFIFLKSLAQEGGNTDAVQFKLTNGSPYNYTDVDFYVALLQNNEMVGILPLHVDSIQSLETKNIDLRNFAPNLNITEIALYPIINIYDEQGYAASHE